MGLADAAYGSAHRLRRSAGTLESSVKRLLLADREPELVEVHGAHREAKS